jgi:DNA-binding NtrC family response regulator
MQMRPRLMVVDDEPGILAMIERFSDQLGFEVVRQSNGSDAIASLATIKPHVVLVDLRMPDVGGMDVLRAVRAADSECEVVLMTAHASIDSAVEAVKLGALDYLTKPFDLDRLRAVLNTVIQNIGRRERLLRVDADLAHQTQFYGMIGRGPSMQELFDRVRRLAPHVRTVLVTGETGTGKELVARALHQLGTRKDRRLVTVNCSAVVENLFESELFGHVRGAFTGATEAKAGLLEHADRGTVFLDEIGELPLALQAKMLRAVEYGELQRVGSLETKKVDVTVIGATNRDLHEESTNGRFRADLYYRLSIVEIHLPPLRERREDISFLSAAFVREFADRMRRPITGMTAAAERALYDYSWPGNVRQLRNVLERACLALDGGIIGDREIMAAMPRQTSAPPADAFPTGDPDDRRLTTAQRQQIERVMREVGGNKSAAARLLGVSRRSLYRWLERVGERDTPAQ